MPRRSSRVRAAAIAVGAALVAVAAAAIVAAAPARRPSEADRVRDAVAALPVIGTLDTGPTPVVVRGTATGKRAAALLLAARQIYDDVGRRFVAPRTDPSPEVALCLAETEAEYAELTGAFADTPSPLGFYRPDLRVAVINLARGIGNLRHELVHPLLGDDFPAIPAWLNEGLGALYGTARARRTGVEPLVNYRLRDLQAAMTAGELPTLDELVGSGEDEVHGDTAPTYYAMGRYVMLYLHRRGRLDATYAALRDAAGDVAAQREIVRAEIDDDAFRAWARRLRYRR